RREAAFRDAEARERLAEAEAKATSLVSDAIAQGDMQAINYFVAQKYVEALKDFASSPNQKTLLLPMETTGVLGSLAGIVELTRSGAAAPVRAAPAKTKAVFTTDPPPSNPA
ncbi:MAG: SPFH/Band 7/PHB domain protein, partial [Xanthomonadales bacterium]|nr:SPFH/Band 7/PHB domain protein [Xanthomonadales bacterium]